MGRDVADHLDVDLPGGEVPTLIVAAEAVEIAAYDDRLQRHRLGVLDDAERGPGSGGAVVDVDDGVEDEMPGAWSVVVIGVAAGGHREQLGDGLGARRRGRPGARERGP